MDDEAILLFLCLRVFSEVVLTRRCLLYGTGERTWVSVQSLTSDSLDANFTNSSTDTVLQHC